MDVYRNPLQMAIVFGENHAENRYESIRVKKGTPVSDKSHILA